MNNHPGDLNNFKAPVTLANVDNLDFTPKNEEAETDRNI
jgi:hypothetical protein